MSSNINTISSTDLAPAASAPLLSLPNELYNSILHHLLPYPDPSSLFFLLCASPV